VLAPERLSQAAGGRPRRRPRLAHGRAGARCNRRRQAGPSGGGPARTLFQGRTDASGSLPIVFSVPSDIAPERC